MHPVLQNKSSLLAYLAAWIPLGLMLGFVLSAAGDIPWTQSTVVTIPLTVVLAFVCLSPWYMCRTLPLESTPRGKLLFTYAPAAACASAIVLAVVHLVVWMESKFVAGLQIRLKAALPVLAAMICLIYILSIAFHYVLLAVESSRRAEILSREAELKALKAQVNPHFLFNGLNSVSALTSADPVKAREMCVRLSDFLRTSLRLGERTSIPFGEELALTRTYLEVEQVRFGQRLRVMQDFDAGCAACDVPPLLFQPLVENAIKHGVATLVEGGEIVMTGRRSSEGLRVVVENPFDPEAPASHKNGFGLASVRNRLHARYGNAAKLEIEVNQNRYRVALWMPVDGNVQ